VTHGNGLVFEDVEQGVRVKASFVDRQFGKSRLCQRLGAFRPAPSHQQEAARRATQRYSPVPVIVPQIAKVASLRLKACSWHLR